MNTPDAQEPLITLSVVTYNNQGIVLETLESLLAEWPGEHAPAITLIDNHSTDGTAAIVKAFAESHDGVDCILSEHNGGYGSGHNLALLHTSSRYHVICNPDIRLRPGALSRLADFMEQHPEVGVVSPRFLFPDGRLQPNNHRLPTFTDLFLRRFIPGRWRRHFDRREAHYLMLDIGYEQVCEVPFPSGAFMFCRTETLQRIGGFDEAFFLYFEDVDLALRVRQAGQKTLFCPEAEVIHLWERAAHKSWRMTWVFARSAIRHFNKWGYRLY